MWTRGLESDISSIFCQQYVSSCNQPVNWDADGSKTIVVLNPDLFEKPYMQKSLFLL